MILIKLLSLEKAIAETFRGRLKAMDDNLLNLKEATRLIERSVEVLLLAHEVFEGPNLSQVKLPALLGQ
jgi:hypothetical protein